MGHRESVPVRSSQSFVAHCKLVSKSSLKLQHLAGARPRHSRNCSRCSSAALRWPGPSVHKPRMIITFFKRKSTRAWTFTIESPIVDTLSTSASSFCFLLQLQFLSWVFWSWLSCLPAGDPGFPSSSNFFHRGPRAEASLLWIQTQGFPCLLGMATSDPL